MITPFNKKEVYTTGNMQNMLAAYNLMLMSRIECEKSVKAEPLFLLGLKGLDENEKLRHSLYVKRSDYRKAAEIIKSAGLM